MIFDNNVESGRPVALPRAGPLVSVWEFFKLKRHDFLFQQDLSNAKHEHTTGRLGRGGAWEGGGSGRGWVGHDAVESIRPKNNPRSSLPAKRRHCLECSLETQATETPFKPTCPVQNLVILHAGRVGTHGGVAGKGRAGLYGNRIVRLADNSSSSRTLCSKASKKLHVNVSLEKRKSKIQCKPIEERNPH